MTTLKVATKLLGSDAGTLKTLIVRHKIPTLSYGIYRWALDDEGLRRLRVALANHEREAAEYDRTYRPNPARLPV